MKDALLFIRRSDANFLASLLPMRPQTVRRNRYPASDALTAYLREIGEFALLTRDEELALSGRARAGDEGALQQLVCANLRFVVSVAKHYQNQGLPLADLINEGNLGLVRAVEKFDGARGVRFTSYGIWLIRRAILQALADHGRPVRVPLGRAGMHHRIRRRANAMCQKLGREPTQLEIAAELSISSEEVETSTRISRESLSFDTPLHDGRGRLLDVIPDTMQHDSSDVERDAQVAATLDHAMAALRSRDALVLRLYFGFGGSDPVSLEGIAGQFGITRERVRQIKERALSRLRKSTEVSALFEPEASPW